MRAGEGADARGCLQERRYNCRPSAAAATRRGAAPAPASRPPAHLDGGELGAVDAHAKQNGLGLGFLREWDREAGPRDVGNPSGGAGPGSAWLRRTPRCTLCARTSAALGRRRAGPRAGPRAGGDADVTGWPGGGTGRRGLHASRRKDAAGRGWTPCKRERGPDQAHPDCQATHPDAASLRQCPQEARLQCTRP